MTIVPLKVIGYSKCFVAYFAIATCFPRLLGDRPWGATAETLWNQSQRLAESGIGKCFAYFYMVIKFIILKNKELDQRNV